MRTSFTVHTHARTQKYTHLRCIAIQTLAGQEWLYMHTHRHTDMHRGKTYITTHTPGMDAPTMHIHTDTPALLEKRHTVPILSARLVCFPSGPSSFFCTYSAPGSNQRSCAYRHWMDTQGSRTCPNVERGLPMQTVEKQWGLENHL
jgi:hypothetical protein